SSLYDLYKNLLTDKQRSYFEDYYFNDLSLFEIADNAHVSRNAIYDQLKKVTDNLDNYENKLGLLKKENKLNELLEEYASSNNSEVLDLINKLKNME
ncbi:MAG: transcriptional regulator, partial [Bacilli bacterium]|nr:transcriptional regulator [Bacilli bacterium]